MQQSHTKYLNKSLTQLQLILNSDPADLQQIDNLLSYIICYPNLSQANIHHQANNVGSNDLLLKQKQIQYKIKNKQENALQVCNCCGVLTQNQPLPYNIKLKHLNLGVGIYLFFRNYLFHSIIFLLMFFVYSLFALITNITSFNQHSQIWQIGFEAINGANKVITPSHTIIQLCQIQSGIAVGFVIAWGLLYMWKTYKQDKYVIEIQHKRISASDFTLMLTHLPRTYFTQNIHQPNLSNNYLGNQQDHLLNKKQPKYFEYLSNDDICKKFNKDFIDYQRSIKSLFSYQVVKVNISKPLFQSTSKDQQNQKKAKQLLHERLAVFRQWINQRKTSNQFSQPVDKRHKCYEQYMNFYVNQFSKNIQKQIDYGDENVVFVTMRSSQAVRQIANNVPPPSIFNFWNCFRKSTFPIHGVRVRKAPQPQQIKWQNIGFPIYEKIKRRILFWILTVFLIGISLGISTAIAFIPENQVNFGISIGISLVVTCINIGIQISMVHISYYQKYYYCSNVQTSIALSIGISQLINSIGVPIVSALISKQFDLKPGGLVDTVFLIAIENAVIPISIFFDPWEQYLKILRWYYSKPENRLHIHTQRQFNQYFGNYYFDIGYAYVYLIRTSIFTAFFVCMQPIIALFAPVGILLYYFATKRNLIYHFQRPNIHFSTVNKSVDFLLSLSLIAFGFGHLLVNNFMHDQASSDNHTLEINWVIACIGLGFVIFLPLRIIHCCITKPKLPQFDYFDKKMLLFTDYDRLNPTTKDTAIAQFKNYIQKLDQNSNLPPQSGILLFQLHNQFRQRQKNRISKNNMISNIQRVSYNFSKLINPNQQLREPLYNNELDYYRQIAQNYQPSPQRSSIPYQANNGYPNLGNQ